MKDPRKRIKIAWALWILRRLQARGPSFANELRYGKGWFLSKLEWLFQPLMLEELVSRGYIEELLFHHFGDTEQDRREESKWRILPAGTAFLEAHNQPSRGTVPQIREWLEEGKGQGATHMLVCCDTFNYEDYPVYVALNQNVREMVKERQNPNKMSKVMEVYSYELDLEEQLKEQRAWHL